jgi:hypothetical protein
MTSGWRWIDILGRPGNAYRTLLMADHEVHLSLLYSGAGGSLGPENS